MANVSDREDDDIKHYENQEFGEHDNYEEIDEAASDNEARIAQRIDLSKTKTHIRNPVLKLNTERLKGSKGIQTIEKYFEGFKFYGKGHERMDLDRIMKRLEHWSYRLFPKYHFDDFLMKVEQLGMKKDLQVFIKKYRLDMITFDSLVMHDNMDEDKEDQQENMPLDDLDLLIMEQIQKQKQAETRASVTTVSTSYEDAFDELLMQSTDIQNSQIQHTNITTVTVTATAANAIAANATIIATTTTNELSSEMKQKIERNKQLAIQRRFQRQKEREEPKRLKFTDNANKQKLNESVNLTIDNKIDESHSDR
ncbi:protein TIPIN homolog [Pogonomyrmex barbatus]|uniref:TIMELESS-interacting protein n=1 Tax=Pogonomyrmex barbatus TaxID=144034 RepID=A0A6I9W1H4_9HYME|nr:protein TIPIN homolog [Pogonomyrmex barbatus]XP_011635487.1 protein TIPIN homolog [Pogonomyrmex barbatus]